MAGHHLGGIARVPLKARALGQTVKDVGGHN
jgi:hypothetical protein